MPLFKLNTPRILKYNLTLSGITIEVERKKIKSIRLSVSPPDGRVRLSAPLFLKEEDINSFLASKTEWIKKHRESFVNNPQNKPYNYEDGEEHPYLGNFYRLEVINIKKTARAEFKDEKIILYAGEKTSKAERQKALENFYRKELNKLLPVVIAKWEVKAGVAVNDYGIKKMKTRWGTCNIRAKRIWLNLELAKRPLPVIEYIVLHEIVHLLERGHNKRFKSFMTRFMPEWKEYEKMLKQGINH